MDQIRIAADSSCDLLTMDGVDFVSVPLHDLGDLAIHFPDLLF